MHTIDTRRVDNYRLEYLSSGGFFVMPLGNHCGLSQFCGLSGEVLSFDWPERLTRRQRRLLSLAALKMVAANPGISWRNP